MLEDGDNSYLGDSAHKTNKNYAEISELNIEIIQNF